MYLRFGPCCLTLFLCLFYTTLAKNNGPRPGPPRRHHRRAVGLSEFLTPPPPPPSSQNQPLFKNNVNNAFRHPKILDPSPPPPTNSPGYFSKFMRWFNPFSRDMPLPPAPPTSTINHKNIQDDFLQPPPPPSPPQNTYRPPVESHTGSHASQATQYQPPDQVLPQPPPPPAGMPYSMLQSIAKSCEQCRLFPWIPMANTAAPPPQEVKHSDFGYGLPDNLNHQVLIPQSSNDPPPQFDSPFTGPIPNPHLYPGAIPPLYKAKDFHQPESEQQALHSEVSSQLANNPTEQINSIANVPKDYNHILFPGPPANAGSGDGCVDVLPPGAEIATGQDQYSANAGEVRDNGSSGSDSHQVLYGTEEHETSAASLNPVVDNVQISQSIDIDNNNDNKNENPNYYRANPSISADERPVIHVEESPIIDLTENGANNPRETIQSGITEQVPVILENSDGTYGINVSWPNGDSSRDSSRIVWPADDDDDEPSATSIVSHHVEQELPRINDNNYSPSTLHQVPDSQNISSILIQVFKNNNLPADKNITANVSTNEKGTDASVFDHVMKSYNNFEKKINELNRPRDSIDPRDIRSGNDSPNWNISSLGMSPRKENSEHSLQGVNRNSKAANRPPGVKKNKQVQIIIPYTTQYSPGPFHPSPNNWDEDSKNNTDRQNVQDVKKTPAVSDKEEYDYFSILQALDTLPKGDILKTKPTTQRANTSIDVLRLQKNIDNWTIQEYSKGTTASTATPSSSHPHLMQSKKIPDEYFTTTEPVTTTIIDETDQRIEAILNSFDFNDLDHEGSASSRVDVPHIRVSLSSEQPSMSSAELDSIPSSIMSGASSEDVSWEQLPVSISPLSNERVHVVTPQTTSKATSFNSNTTSEEKIQPENESSNGNSTTQFESIERAYQVLPQAVNNLAVASTGPATVPLWGIMGHEDYASLNTTNEKSDKPILYSGHSKVSHSRQ